MIWDRPQRLAARSLAESASESEQAFLSFVHAPYDAPAAFSMNLTFFSFPFPLCFYYYHHRPEGGSRCYLCISHDRTNERTDEWIGWAGGRTEEIIMTTERCICTHTHNKHTNGAFSCFHYTYPRYDARSSELNGRGSINFILVFSVLTGIPSQRARLMRDGAIGLRLPVLSDWRQTTYGIVIIPCRRRGIALFSY